VLARATEIATLLTQVQRQADMLAQDPDLRAVLASERAWLQEAQRTVAEVKAWRAQEQRRDWPSSLARWAAALLFALTSAAAAGAGYAWRTRPDAGTLAQQQAYETLGRTVEARRSAMTRAERRQFDALLTSTPSLDH
jgi:hypothetical protein